MSTTHDAHNPSVEPPDQSITGVGRSTLLAGLALSRVPSYVIAAFLGWRARRERRANHEPPYGFGRGARPLWTKQDRRAEQIREVLRVAGLREANTHAGGFTVSTSDVRSRFRVTCHDRADAVDALACYHQALADAAYGARVDPNDVYSVLVHRR